MARRLPVPVSLAGALCAVPLVLALAAPRPAGPPSNPRDCVDTFDATADYFPDKVRVEEASGFTVEYRRSYKLVTVGHDPAERYVLVQCGTPPPAVDGAQVVSVPITSLFSGSNTQLGALVDLDRLDVVTGVPRLADMTGPALEARAASGDVREFAPASVVDVERVVASRPSVVVAMQTADAALAPVRQAGVPVVADVEWREPTALARAEWLKFIALFLNEEARARGTYAAVKARYAALRAQATAVPADERPLVMTGRSTRGLFTIAGGRSYVAALIEDAGGRYVWADNASPATDTVDIEAEVRRAADADVWINGGGWADLAAMARDEPRYAAFKAYRTGNVWVYERRMRPSGANDYWSRSVTHPDMVLADLVKILHPRLLPDHTLEWYMRVPRVRQ